MDHGPASEWGEDKASPYKTRIGLILFAVYGVIYAAFVAINTIKPKIMETLIVYGLNAAIVYGFFLILLAVVMGLVYNALCSKKERDRL